MLPPVSYKAPEKGFYSFNVHTMSELIEEVVAPEEVTTPEEDNTTVDTEATDTAEEAVAE